MKRTKRRRRLSRQKRRRRGGAQPLWFTKAQEKLITNSYSAQGFYAGQQEYKDKSLSCTLPQRTQLDTTIIDIQTALQSQVEQDVSYVGSGKYSYIFLVDGTTIMIKVFFRDSKKMSKQTRNILTKLGLQLCDTDIVVVQDIYHAVVSEFAPYGLTTIVIPTQSVNQSMVFKSLFRQKANQTLVNHLYNNMLAALFVLHEKGWIHGDIKPDNITCHPDTLMVTIIDYDGICNNKDIPCEEDKMIYSAAYTVRKNGVENITTQENDVMSLILSFLEIFFDLKSKLGNEKEAILAFLRSITPIHFRIQGVQTFVKNLSYVNYRYTILPEQVVLQISRVP